MRFQHGLCDSPTRWAICASDRLASSCRSATILRSMASISWPLLMRLLSGRSAQISRRQGLQLDRLPKARAQRGGQALEVLVDRAGIARQPAVGALEPGKAPAALLTHHTAFDAAGGGDGPEGGFVNKERHGPTVLSGPLRRLNESGRRL